MTETEVATTEYAVVIERSASNYGAWVPDLDGCVSTGTTLEEAKANITEAIEMHIESLREHGETIPPPLAHVAVVQVAP
jgi:predicted RNase H-like HicB family nuclease